MWSALRAETDRSGIRTFDFDGDDQGIVHVVGPEQGIVLPGLTVVCGDSHTCTNGALGALAFGVGNSQSTQALATQVLLQQRPRQMRIRIDGVFRTGVTAKDAALAIIAELGASAGSGFAVEYAGAAVDAMDIEARLTLCNLTVELGAKFGMIGPDERTIAWVTGRAFAPTGDELESAVRAWRELRSDEGALFDREVAIDASTIEPMVTWGTSPEHAIPINGTVPDPADAADDSQRDAWQAALDYMDLQPGRLIAGTSIDWVFIGSCANSRLSDLRDAARIVGGRRAAPGVTAWVVPGSEQVRRAAEREGLDELFRDAGFEWRRPGCSMCVAANGDRVPRGARCVSTSNRNFVGRQGPEARTHLASPAMAAAAAVTGALVDVRTLGRPRA
jgi:3-isopropylmalate/(R)-2-methylmalate dehydratase large subunit